MNLWFRLIRVLLASLFRARLDYLETSRIGFRVMPHDLDINVHMNNARYLALMDLGRFDLIVRTGLWRPMLKNKWQAVIGGALVRYRRPLKPFQPFTLSTRLLFWDERWLYIEHRIEAAGVPACLTLVRGAFLRNGAIVPPAEVAALAGFTGNAPEIQSWSEEWRRLDGAFDQQPALTLAKEEKTCVR